MMGWPHDTGDWIWMSAMMALMWLPVLFVALWFLREVARPKEGDLRSDGGPRHDSPRETARRAYAHGELPRERFLEIMRDLEETEAEAPQR